MKTYDFKKAKEIIAKSENLKEASLGMHEDWWWTAEIIWVDGNYTRMLSNEADKVHKQYKKDRKNGKSLLDACKEYEDILIGGIYGSSWATPTLQLIFNDGTEKMIPCHKDDKKAKDIKSKTMCINAGQGVISKEVQKNITPLSKD